MAEKKVQTVKKLLKKALANGEDPYLALLAYRTKPGINNTPSSAKKPTNSFTFCQIKIYIQRDRYIK